LDRAAKETAMAENEMASPRPARAPLETLACAGRYLERFGWPNYALREADGVPVLLTAWGRDGTSFELMMHCESDPDEILAVVSHVLSATPDKVAPDGLAALRELVEERNSQLRRGTWIYDAHRREVHFRLSMLLGGELDYEAVRALVVTAVNATESMFREGRVLLAAHPAQPLPRSRYSASALLSQARLALLLGDRAGAEKLLTQIGPESLPAGSTWASGNRPGTPD